MIDELVRVIVMEKEHPKMFAIEVHNFLTDVGKHSLSDSFVRKRTLM